MFPLNIFSTLVFVALALKTESKIELKNNGFTGIVIAINPEVDEDPRIIDAIKASWTEASADLYRATRNRAFFKEVTILVPTTWTEGYYGASDGETYNKAAVIVAYENPAYGDYPYTLQYGSCGQQGSYIHLTPNYLLDDRYVEDNGPRGKTIIHEWAHYRWGVFDEIVTDGYNPFYLSAYGKVEANRCPTTIQGNNFFIVDWNEGVYRSCNLDPQTLLPEDGCIFVPDESKSSAAEASIMSYQYLESVYTFCHDDTEDTPNLHNRAAPNEHNRLCNLRSTWDVISSSDDFARDNNSSVGEIDTEPVFNVVQPKSYERFVLVLDTSGSMDGVRMQMMRQAASTFILQAAPTDSEIGIVEFSNVATTLSDMVEITDYDDRMELNDLLPTEAIGGTSIGSGIREAIEVLAKGGKKTEGGILIVLSDGQENTAPTLVDVYNETINSGVIVYSVVFTAEADPMLQVIADDTGGIWYFADENDDQSTASLTDAFVTVAQVSDGDSYRETYQIYSTSFTIDPPAQHFGSVMIDDTVGNNSVFTFTWSQYDIPLEIVLTAPSGCNYVTTTSPQLACDPGYSPAIDTDLKTIRFVISGTAEEGEWMYNVKGQSQYSQKVVVTVTSMASNLTVQPIVVESGMSQIEASEGEAVVVYAQVSQGYAPVLNADVTARIERPAGNPVTIVLKDGGAAPDVRKNDGIYSRYFTKYTGPGRYSVQVSVTGVAGKTNTAGSNPNSKAAFRVGNNDNGKLSLNPNLPPGSPTLESTGNFSRYTSPGGFSYNGTSAFDVFPPSQISDLLATQQEVTSTAGGIKIKFTAPGDDYDEGTAASYEIRYTYSDPLFLLDSFDSAKLISSADLLAGCLSSPKEAGSEEFFVFSLPDLPDNSSEILVSIAVRASDEVGNVGGVSNVQTITYFVEPLVYNEPEGTDVELILMIVFICISAILMLMVCGLVWKILKLKEDNKVEKHKASYANNHIYDHADC